MSDNLADPDTQFNSIDREGSQETVPAEVSTRIEMLNTRFFFHELLKESEHTKHYIIEDIEVDPATLADPEAPLFFYLKQLRFTTKAEYVFARKYYMKIYRYCKMPFAKSDIVRLNYIFDFDSDDDKYYELVLIYDYGEADRIDVDNISTAHINKFLKNVCLLLNDLDKFDEIYHGNVSLKNIILVNNELKLSGFKSRYLDDFTFRSWKVDMAREYGVYRLDLFLIGLLWLVFLDVDVHTMINKDMGLEDVRQLMRRITKDLPNDKRIQIVVKMLDLGYYPQLTLDDIILDFDEQYILENIKMEENRDDNYNNEMNYASDPMNLFGHQKSMESMDADDYAGKLKKNTSKETNLFMKPYKESERDIMNQKLDEEQTAQLHDSQDLMIKMSGADFTLRDDNSVVYARPGGDDVITIMDINTSLPHEEDYPYDQNRMTLDPEYGRPDKHPVLSNRHNSARQLLKKAESHDDGNSTALRKLKSNAVLGLNDRTNEPVRYDLEKIAIDMDAINQEVEEEASENENLNKVYSYRNIDAKLSSKATPKDSDAHKSSMVENRYATDDKVEDEDSYKSLGMDRGVIRKVDKVVDEEANDSPNGFHIEKTNSGVDSKIEKNSDDLGYVEKTHKIIFNDDTEENMSEYLSNHSYSNKQNLYTGKVDDKINSSNRNFFEDLEAELEQSHKENEEISEIINVFLDSEVHKDSEIDAKVLESTGFYQNLLSEQPHQFENDNSNPKLSALKGSKINRSALRDSNIRNSLTLGTQSKQPGNKDSQSMSSKVQAAPRRSNLNKPIAPDREKRTSKLASDEKKNFIKKTVEDTSALDVSQPKVANGIVERPTAVVNQQQKSSLLKRGQTSQERPNWNDEGLAASNKRMRFEDKTQERSSTPDKEKGTRLLSEKRKHEREALLLKQAQIIKDNQELKAKIEKKAQQKIEEKKAQKRSVSRDSNPNQDNQNGIKRRVTPTKEGGLRHFISQRKDFEIMKQDNQRPEVKANAKNGQISKHYRSASRLKTSDIKKQKKPSIEELDKKMKKIIKMSSGLDRKNMFEYSSGAIRDKSFKKLLLNKNTENVSILEKPNKSVDGVVKTPKPSLTQSGKIEYLMRGLNRSTERREQVSDIEAKLHKFEVKNPTELVIKRSSKESQDHSDLNKRVDILLNQTMEKSISNRREATSNQSLKKKAGDMNQSLNREGNGSVDMNRDIEKMMANRNYVDESINKSLILDRDASIMEKSRLSSKARNSNTTKNQLMGRTVKSVAFQVDEQARPVVNIDKDEDEFSRQIVAVQSLIDLKELNEALPTLSNMLKKVTGTKKMVVFKMMASVHFKLKDQKNCMDFLHKCLDYIDASEELQNKVELKQGVILSLGISLIDVKQSEEAINALNDPVFSDKSKLPFNYYSILGDAYSELGKLEEAFVAYNNQLRFIKIKDIDPMAIKSLFIVVTKTTKTLNAINYDLRLVQFYRYLLPMADSILKVNATFGNGSDDHKALKELLVLTVVSTLLSIENYGISNFILNDVATTKCLQLEKLEDEDKLRFVDVVFQFTAYLKEFPDYGNQKDCYLRYLLFIRDVLKLCENSDECIRRRLMVRFQEGLFHLKEKDYAKAKRSFDQALTIYNTQHVEPDSELFALLFNIAINLYTSEQYADSVFFFEKILSLKCSDSYMRNKSIKMLSKAYFRTGQYPKGYNLLAGWIIKDLDTDDRKARNFFRYVSLYYLCSSFTRFADFEQALSKLKSQSQKNYKAETVHYFNVYFNLTHLSVRNKNYKQNDDVVNRVAELLRQKAKKSFGQEFVAVMCLVYNNYILNKNDVVFTIEDFLMSFFKPELSIDDNISVMTTFLINFMLTSMCKIPTNPEKQPSGELTSYMLDNVGKLRNNVNLYNYILDIVTSALEKTSELGLPARIPVISIKDDKPDTITLDTPIVSTRQSKTRIPAKSETRISAKNQVKVSSKVEVKTQNTPKPVSTRVSQKALPRQSQKTTPTMKTVLKTSFKTTEEKVLKKITTEVSCLASNLEKPEECLCFEYLQKNPDLNQLIMESYRSIKMETNSLVVINVPETIAAIDRQLAGKKLNWDKYIYIKKLANFLIAQRNEVVDRDSFMELLEILITDLPLCVHDYKIIIGFLEAFRDKDYLEILVIFLDKNHQNLAKMVINQLFLDNFDKMYIKLKTELFALINNNQAEVVGNSPFLHIFDPEEKLTLDGEYSVEIKKKARHAVLDDKALSSILVKHVEPHHLDHFYLRYTTYCATIDLLTHKKDEIDIISALTSSLLRLISVKNVSVDLCEFFTYDVLLVAFLLKFPKATAKPIANSLVEILGLLNPSNNPDNYYHFAKAASSIGSIFYRFKMSGLAVKTKKMALKAIKNLKGQEIVFPAFYPQQDIKLMVFGIFSVLFVDSFTTRKKELIEKYYQKVEMFPLDDPCLKIDQMCIEVLFFVHLKDFEAVRTTMVKIQSTLADTTFNGIEAELYPCAIDKISLDSSIATGKYGDITRKKDRYKKSFRQLVKSLAAAHNA